MRPGLVEDVQMRLIPIQARFLGRLLARHRQNTAGPLFYFRKSFEPVSTATASRRNRMQKACTASTGKA
jgi:hypothetical protein